MGTKTKWKRISKVGKFKKSSRPSSDYKETKEKIEKIFKTKKDRVKCFEILACLSKSPHFIGCFSQDDLVKLELSYPCYMIVNTDSRGEKGSHWLALKLDSSVVEIFDPLGFEIFNYKQIPCHLLEFIHDHANDKKLKISPRIQSDSSSNCALYCIFYIFYRNFNSFNRLCSLFSKNLKENDDRLKLLVDVCN